MRSKDWYNQLETKAKYRRMCDPFGNIYIGTDPTDGFTKKDADFFDAIVNVSDSECAYFYPSKPDQKMHWFPINECGYWGYASFYYIKKVLDWHYDQGHNIYLHCHAGANRSPTMFVHWLTSKGYSLFDASVMEYYGRKEHPIVSRKDKGWNQHVYFNINQGHIPKNLTALYANMGVDPQIPLAGCLLNKGNIDDTTDILAEPTLKRHRRYTRYRLYYKFKGKIKDIPYNVKLFLSGKCTVQLDKGISTTCKRKDRDKVLKAFKDRMRKG